MTKPLFGGWTPAYEGDPCRGGHPPQSISDGTCGRCGRSIDRSHCLCGAEGHQSLSRSMCPRRMRFDQRDAHEHLRTEVSNTPYGQATLTLLGKEPSDESVLAEDVDRWSRHLLHISQHNMMTIFLAGRIQEVANEMREAAGLTTFVWGDSVPDAEFQQCSVHGDNCKGQETH